MMTQGWRNYLWNSIRYTTTLKEMYPIEKGFYMDGAVFNYNNRRSAVIINLNFLTLKQVLTILLKLMKTVDLKLKFLSFTILMFFSFRTEIKETEIGNLGYYPGYCPVPVINYRNNELPYISYKPGYLKALNEKFAEIESANESDIKYINLPEVKIIAKSDRPVILLLI